MKPADGNGDEEAGRIFNRVKKNSAVFTIFCDTIEAREYKEKQAVKILTQVGLLLRGGSNILTISLLPSAVQL